VLSKCHLGKWFKRDRRV